MKNILSCLTILMLGIGIMHAAKDTAGYQSIRLINNSNNTFTLNFDDATLTPESVTVEKGKDAEIKAKPGEVIKQDEKFQLKLTKGKGGIGISYVDLKLSEIVDQESKFGLKMNENDPEHIWFIIRTNVSGSELKMTIEHSFPTVEKRLI